MGENGREALPKQFAVIIAAVHRRWGKGSPLDSALPLPLLLRTIARRRERRRQESLRVFHVAADRHARSSAVKALFSARTSSGEMVTPEKGGATGRRSPLLLAPAGGSIVRERDSAKVRREGYESDREERRSLHGVRMARGAPSISHLVFADDCLFFFRANNLEVGIIRQILDEYGRASGQEVNLSKTSIVFGNNVHPKDKEAVCEVLGVHEQLGGGKYLGVPRSSRLSILLQPYSNHYENEEYMMQPYEEENTEDMKNKILARIEELKQEIANIREKLKQKSRQRTSSLGQETQASIRTLEDQMAQVAKCGNEEEDTYGNTFEHTRGSEYENVEGKRE
nr:ribonuclease H [Ipomoea batatas]